MPNCHKCEHACLRGGSNSAVAEECEPMLALHHAPAHRHRHPQIRPPTDSPPPRHPGPRAPWPRSFQAVTVSSHPSPVPARKEQPKPELSPTRMPTKTEASCTVLFWHPE